MRQAHRYLNHVHAFVVGWKITKIERLFVVTLRCVCVCAHLLVPSNNIMIQHQEDITHNVNRENRHKHPVKLDIYFLEVAESLVLYPNKCENNVLTGKHANCKGPHRTKRVKISIQLLGNYCRRRFRFPLRFSYKKHITTIVDHNELDKFRVKCFMFSPMRRACNGSVAFGNNKKGPHKCFVHL